jgi:flagellar biosynthesis protein FlhF
MLVKTFQAVSMSEALKMVKAELGPDAMIISSNQERRKGILGFFRKPVFKITAAVDQSPRPQRPVVNPYVQTREEVSNTREEFQKSMLEPLVREIRELRDRVDSMKSRDAGNDGSGKAKSEKTGQARSAGNEGGFIPLNGALTDKEKLRKLLIETVGGKSLKSTGISAEKDESVLSAESPSDNTAPVSLGTEHQGNLEKGLNDAGLERMVIEKLLGSVSLVQGQDETVALNEVKVSLAGMVRCSGHTRSKKKGPRIIALVGPTGVGKTTTIAKLAAMYILKKKAKLVLVTTDTFRAGAVEQLRTYAKILGIQLETAATKAELEKALEKHPDKDMILIDTAGKSAMDNGKMDELAVLLEADPGIEKHLCLSATTRDEDLQAIVDQFKVLPVHRVLFTKLDESRKLGCVVNVALQNDLSISYVTNGQRVPEDIEIASGKKIANMVLGM